MVRTASRRTRSRGSLWTPVTAAPWNPRRRVETSRPRQPADISDRQLVIKFAPATCSLRQWVGRIPRQKGATLTCRIAQGGTGGHEPVEHSEIPVGAATAVGPRAGVVPGAM